MKRAEVKVLRDKELQVENNLVLKEKKCIYLEMKSWEQRLFDYTMIYQWLYIGDNGRQQN